MQHRSLFVLGFALATIAASSCAERRVAGPPPEQSTARVQLPAPPIVASAAPLASAAPSADPSAEIAAAPPPAEPACKAWADCIRIARYADAAAKIDALGDDEKNKPETKYARARVAIELGDMKTAAELLDGLEQSLPFLASDIAKYRAEAQLVAGPFASAAAYFAKSKNARDVANAADAYRKAKDLEQALSFADRAVQIAQRSRQHHDEAFARTVRARVRQDKGWGPAAEMDLRWIAVHAPASAEGRAAADALDAAKHPLTEKERMQAIDGLLDAASPAAVAEINRVANAAETRPDLLHSRAMALYKARQWGDAAKAFDAAVEKKVGNAAEELYYAGRAYTRAGDDDTALARFAEVTEKWKQSPYNERSAYLIARLELQDGKFDDAVKSYAKYLDTFKKGEHKSDAEYEKALAHLSSSDPKDAKAALAKLAGRARGDEIGRIKELQGLASFRAGDRDEAITIWSDLVKTQPLTWAALTAHARLQAIGAAAPPLVDTPWQAPQASLSVKLPEAPALLAKIGLDADAEAYLAHAERDVARQYPNHEGEALCELYGMLAPAKRRFKIGTGTVAWQTLLHPPNAGERWAWECVYPRPYEGNVRLLEAEDQIPHGFMYALMRQESGFDPEAQSPASAIGLMQLMPATAKHVSRELSIDFDPNRLTNPETNLRLAAFYIQKLLKMFDGSSVLAAAAYNAGPKAVSHWSQAPADNEVDIWVARIPYDETRAYVAKVMQNLARYQWLEGGEQAITKLSLELPKTAKAPDDAY